MKTSIQRRIKKNGFTVDNDEEEEPESDQLRRRSTDNRDPFGDLMQKIKWRMHTDVKQPSQPDRLATSLDRGKQGEQITGLARRLMYLEWDVRKGRHQFGSFIGTHLRKEGEAKRRSLVTYPNYNEADTCAVYLRTHLKANWTYARYNVQHVRTGSTKTA